MKLLGTSDTMEKKSFTKRGLECTTDDFTMPNISKKSVTLTSRRRKNMSLYDTTEFMLPKYIQTK